MKHLLNHTEAWLDKKVQEVQSDDKHLIIRIVLMLLGMLFILFDLYSVFSNKYFLLGSSNHFFYLYGGILLGSQILTFPIIPGMKKRELLRAIDRQQKALSAINSSKKSLQFYIIKDHIKLLSPQGQALIWKGLQAYKGEQGLKILLWLSIALIALGCALGIPNFIYNVNWEAPLGRLVPGYYDWFLILKFVWLLIYIFLAVAIFSINLCIRQCLAYIKTPTK